MLTMTVVYEGALLSLLVEPIYWSSVVVGSLYHRVHMTRAMFGRVKLEPGALPDGYSVNRPMLSAVSVPEPRVTQKATSYAVNWIASSSDVVEVINTTTGRQHSGSEPSRLCKADMFRLFADTWNMLNSGQDFPPVYSEVKRIADDYQTAKITLYKALSEADLGCWMERPREQDNFTLSQ